MLFMRFIFIIYNIGLLRLITTYSIILLYMYILFVILIINNIVYASFNYINMKYINSIKKNFFLLVNLSYKFLYNDYSFLSYIPISLQTKIYIYIIT